MKTVSLILARGGSKGIPKKNIKELNGAPLISYTIEASLSSRVNETWVSTDCWEIRDIALEYGAKVIKRPQEFSTCDSKNEDALLHFADQVEFDNIVSIQPTSPLLTSEDINGGLKLMNKDCDSVFSATKEHWIPRWKKDGFDNFSPINWSLVNRPMRQQMEETYIENGAFWITTKERLQKFQLRYSGKIKPFCMPLIRSFQIDSIEDFNLVNIIMHERDLCYR